MLDVRCSAPRSGLLSTIGPAQFFDASAPCREHPPAAGSKFRAGSGLAITCPILRAQNKSQYTPPQPPPILAGLPSRPGTKPGTRDDVLDFIVTNPRYGRGVEWNDLQVLVAARLSGNPLWSLDARLATAAIELGVAYVIS